jgi:hypothetical protein
LKSTAFWKQSDPTSLRQVFVLNTALLEQVARGPITSAPDIEVAVALARFVHDEYESFGTNSEHHLTDAGSAMVLRALKAVLKRLGISNFDPPFLDFPSFKSYWKANGASGGGGWQARRNILDADFAPLHKVLDEREAGSITSKLANPISTLQVTGWPRVDEEISELRRHFESASTRQDYSNIGNDVVAVLEALSGAVYNHRVHGRADEPEPPVSNTKNRLDRYIDVSLPGPKNAELRRLARTSIEMAQAVKHRRSTIDQIQAGISADSVILLVNMLRRLDQG